MLGEHFKNVNGFQLRNPKFGQKSDLGGQKIGQKDFFGHFRQQAD